MTETTELAAPQETGSQGSRGSLSTMKLDELKRLAATMGISGTSKMRKGDLLTAIRERGESGSSRTAPSAAQAESATTDTTAAAPARRASRRAGSAVVAPAEQAEQVTAPAQARESDDGHVVAPARDERRDTAADRSDSDRSEAESGDESHQGQPRQRRNDRNGSDRYNGGDRSNGNDRQNNRNGNDRNDRQGNDRQGSDRSNNNDRQSNRNGNDRNGNDRNGNDRNGNDRDGQGNDRWNNDDSRQGGRRRQRGRDRKRGRGRGADDFGDVDVAVREDDVLVPVAGILDVLDNYAFVRTSGYLAGPNDVYVPLNMVKKNGMRKGDAITGAIRALREGEQLPTRQKFNALVRVDTVNGMQPEQARERVEFSKLTPLYPQERLRLEDDPKHITNRVIDLVAPIGKGQRGLIVAPAKSGKTLVMQAIANAITANNPECHLMVVLVDERPEEVTDFQRSVKGEVIASTFDRPASDHTEVSELAIERAKRLVEMGLDVVVLLDGITRLGRAYNLAAPASGRIMSGGVDSAALYPPKKFFGAARNIENGGSLTILATALIDSGSKMDEVIFEEFKGTGNWELRLSRQLAERRIFPAIDVNGSGTRREEILLGSDELKIMWKLRRVLAALDNQQGIELLLDRLKKTHSNTEFLMQVQQTSSIKLDDED
ncbi:transcription termination factor Rho [Rudaeicoccus suwonensis]|uniref:Transcription termination factor Rho n=2 Tax=Rudaeicoccus suwonensis TaxID=657409 RepID=A0A561DX84_9MICO|nr:transcription termination factor Rho [Rudaeicoccus suwonensis]TWE07988.1 transcription termination factor Rho [Rudaeicoccus suwonensis]